MFDIDQINPYTYSKVLIQRKSIKNNLKEKEENKFQEKLKSALTIRRVPRVKSALLFDAEKELKRVTLSSNSFTQYMRINQEKNKIRETTLRNKKLSPFALIESQKEEQSQRNRELPDVLYKKLEIKENKTERDKKARKKYLYHSTKDIKKININKKSVKNDYNLFNNFSNMNINEEETTIKEMPYGFKYKDTRIIYDKSKMNKIKSTVFPFEENNEYNNITDIPGLKNIKEKFGKTFYKVLNRKKEEEKNETFKFFFEGDFLEKNKNLLKKAKKREFILKNEEAINYLNDLYDICKGIEKFNGRDFRREMKYNLKKYYYKEDLSFVINMESLCLKFYKQNELNNNKNIKPQKLFLPFTYLLFFYLLDFETFKVFLSEILIYNEEKREMEINQKEIRNILIKYKKYIQFNLGPFFTKDKKNKIDNYEKYEKITYNCNERNFLKIYDWIIHINSNKDNENLFQFQENKNIIYKVKIILPIIKFNLSTRKIRVKKYIHKNIIINLLKTSLANWEEKILCDLFFNKRFRYIMNSLLSQKHMYFHSKNIQKIFIDKIDYNQDILNKYKYEFFITDAIKEHSRYLYISSYEILLFYGRENDKFNYNKHINLKDSININKFRIYWGYINTIMKCIHIDKNERKAYFDFNILENSPTKFFKLKVDQKLELNTTDKNTLENIKNFYNLGYMMYRNEGLLIDMFLINFILVEPCLVRLNFERYNYKIPKDLLNILTQGKNIFDTMSTYISEFSDNILTNKALINLNYDDFQRRVNNKNLNKNVQDRLKTFSMGLLNKTNTFKNISYNSALNKNDSNLKRGISSNFGSLFGKNMLNLNESYKKSNTKKFGGSIFANVQKIEEKNEVDVKKDKKVSIWKRLSLKKKVEEKRESKELKTFNQINIVDFKEEENEQENERKIEKYKLKRKKTQVIKCKFAEKAEFFKDYIDKDKNNDF